MTTQDSNNPSYLGAFDNDVTGWRIVATLIDFVPLTILFFGMALTLGAVESAGASFNAALDGWQSLHFLALVLVYYTLLEAVTGTTIGKMLLGLRVLRMDGQSLRFKDAILRNTMRVIDGFPVLYLVGIVSIGMTTWNQRLGDLAAGTQVVRVLPRPVTDSESSEQGLSNQSYAAVPTDFEWKTSLIPKPESTEGRPWGQPLKKPAGAPLNLG